MADDLDELSVSTICMNSVKTVPIECTQEGGYTHTHTRTHARRHARTQAPCLRLRNTFVYGMTSLLFDLGLTSSRQVSEVDETAFHRVRTSTLGRFTISMAESSCISLYATCGVRSLDTPVFL